MRCLFFCGHKSLYGASHLVPLINSSLETVGIVLATDARWNKFGRGLRGKQYLTDDKVSMLRKLKRMSGKMLRVLSRSLRRCQTASSVLPDSPNVEEVAAEHGIPIDYVDDVNSRDFLELMDNIDPDLIICAAYPQIFGKELLQKSRLGALNSHPSLLPKFRGAHPHFWAIREGEEKSGITVHFMTQNLDDGDIVAQVEFTIKEYTYSQLYSRIVQETPKLVNQVCDFFLKGQGEARKQDASKATYYRNDRPIHHRIFWNLQTASEIYNLVRTERAFCFFRNCKVSIRRCYLSETNRNLTNNAKVEDGTVIDICEDSLVVKARYGCVNIQSLSYNGERMSFHKFSRKTKVEIGEKFE